MKIKNLFIFTLLSFVTISCSQATEQAPTNYKLVTIADNFEHPWSVDFLPDGGYLVTERPGKLWRVFKTGQKKEISGVPQVFNEGQGGLLDVKLEPNFKNNGWVYFSYAGEDSEGLANTEVARAKLSLTQNNLTKLEIIFKAEPKVSGSNHWGSRLLFTPDGYLFITLGERYNHMKEAQNPHNHLGSIVRLNPDGSTPKNNPFVSNKKGNEQVFSYGHRNVQGITLHPETNEIWQHEHGPKGGDEINILKAGKNYGWPKVTFGINYWGTKITDKTTAPGMEDPILQWTPSIAPSGMTFYTGDKFPAWKGSLFVGSLAFTHLRLIELNGTKVTKQEELLTDLDERIRDVRQGPNGYLYVLTDTYDGKLIRLEPTN
ncbi:MAG: glucose dehydrogenase [Magnetococcales bacterium]|nr:glucose dehydrogenase [Magnetococcales bacterium]PPR16539.1 MAG: Soluble aldose sugar dehydrogenase YliI [Pseudomonadota bacterium]|tara:strand:- start:1006 stop:2127 length:1122 start_codon:yes stop_codon:yes gene_type:complete